MTFPFSSYSPIAGFDSLPGLSEDMSIEEFRAHRDLHPAHVIRRSYKDTVTKMQKRISSITAPANEKYLKQWYDEQISKKQSVDTVSGN